MLAQFVPIVRTFLPFVAGGAGMPYRAFIAYNAAGAITWVGSAPAPVISSATSRW